jgi:hypothetical protein
MAEQEDNKGVEEKREDAPATPPVEPEEGAEEEEEEAPAEQDIDFEKELEALESSEEEEKEPARQPAPAPSGKTEEEKAAHVIRESVKRLQRKGRTADEIFDLTGVRVEDRQEPEAPQRGKEGYVTRDELDLRDAEKEASRLARSESEKKVIMWYVRVKRLSVSDAHLLANKGRARRAEGEIARAAGAVPAAPPASGERSETAQAHRFTRAEMDMFQRRQMKWNPKTKRMEGKFTFVRIDEKTGERVSGKLSGPAA